MNFLSVLYTVIISPIEMIIEAIFCLEMNKVGVFGAAGAIVAVSLAVSFLTLPIYNVADAIQKRERDTQAKLSHWVNHIKKHFTGDERFMMLSYYYKQNGYHPLYALRSSLSIMIEVPFFIAAYHFLSHCPALQDARCGVLRDLGKPDALITLGALHLNLLPILMTAINAVSSAVYLKGFTVREKAQTYGLALIFLVLLYNSPSGLVLYWTLNNLFSLAKNAVQRWCKKPWLAAHGCVAAMFIAVPLYRLLQTGRERSVAKWAAILVCALLYALFPVFVIARGRIASLRATAYRHCERSVAPRLHDGGFPLFLASAAALALLLGLVLPSSTIATSPEEFCFIGDVASPLYYVWRSLCVFAGLFVLWPLVLYKMLAAAPAFGGIVKRTMPYLFAFALALALLDVYVFGFDYGTMDNMFRLDRPEVLLNKEKFYTLLPLLAMMLAAAVLFAVHRLRWTKYLSVVCVALLAAETALSAGKIRRISNAFIAARERKTLQDADGGLSPIYHLSKTGKNVVVLFLDKAVSSFFPYIVRQFPHLAKDFDGFVFYPNTVSLGWATTKATPAMMGGYEYSPLAMNKRADELLVKKHNEAMLVAPKLFMDAGFEVVVTDPPYPNYANNDTAPFEPYSKNTSRAGSEALYPDMTCKFVKDNYVSRYKKDSGLVALLHDNGEAILSGAAGFSVMQAVPPLLRKSVYSKGFYWSVSGLSDVASRNAALSEFAFMYYLSALTDCSAKRNTYTFICSELTHAPAILKEGEYIPAAEAREETATCGYYKWKIPPSKNTQSDLAFYHTNTAAMLQTAKWLDKLRALGVYDNTRIIIVADHGAEIPTPAFGQWDRPTEYARFNPLFMFKDFGAHGSVQTDNSFMTNADTILLAKQGLPVSDTNPFTGKSLSAMADKSCVLLSPRFVKKGYSEGNTNDLKTKQKWILTGSPLCHTYKVHDNIFDEKNWTRLDDDEEASK